MAHTYDDVPGAGSVLQISISSTYTEIPGVSEVSHDGFKRGVRNPTGLNSGRVRKKPGMTDFGQLKAKGYFDPNNTTHIAVRDKLTNGLASDAYDTFKLIYPDGGTSPANVTFSGFVSEFAQTGATAPDGTWEFDLTIEVDNVTAFTAGNPTT